MPKLKSKVDMLEEDPELIEETKEEIKE